MQATTTGGGSGFQTIPKVLGWVKVRALSRKPHRSFAYTVMMKQEKAFRNIALSVLHAPVLPFVTVIVYIFLDTLVTQCITLASPFSNTSYQRQSEHA